MDDFLGTVQSTATIDLGQSRSGRVDFDGDTDWFAIELLAGQTYVFSLVGSPPGGLVDPLLQLHNAAGALVARDDDAGAGLNAQLTYTAQFSGAYFISAQGYADSVGRYNLRVDPGAPQDPLRALDAGFALNTTNVTVHLLAGGATFDGERAVRSWTAEERAAVERALGTYSEATNLTFSFVSDPQLATFVLIIGEFEEPTELGFFAPGPSGGYGAFNPDGIGWTSSGLRPGGLGFTTILHELGHGLGLAHPHDNFGYGSSNSEVLQGVVTEFGSYGDFQLNQGVFTLLSYNDGWSLAPHGETPSISYGHQANPAPLDLGLLQRHYGVNASTRTGDNTYFLPNGNVTGVSYTSIVDAGGMDVISAPGVGDAVIDLRPATLQSESGGGGFVSYVHGVHGGFTIPAGVVIENARGGTGADRITGNAEANLLEGGGGRDQLLGGDGDDRLIGGPDGDYLDGGDGRDTVSYEGTGAGVNTRPTNSELRFDDAYRDQFVSIENVIGSAFGDILISDYQVNVLAGGEGDDQLFSYAGDDVLYGGAGADQLEGGEGQDILLGDEHRSLGRWAGLTLGRGPGAIDVPLVALKSSAASEGFGQGLLGMLEANHPGVLAYMVAFAAPAADILGGGPGDDILFGGAGPDTLVFNRAEAGSDVVYGLDAEDSLQLLGFGFEQASEVLSRLRQVGEDVVFADADAVIRFKGVLIGLFEELDYSFA